MKSAIAQFFSNPAPIWRQFSRSDCCALAGIVVVIAGAALFMGQQVHAHPEILGRPESAKDHIRGFAAIGVKMVFEEAAKIVLGLVIPE